MRFAALVVDVGATASWGEDRQRELIKAFSYFRDFGAFGKQARV